MSEGVKYAAEDFTFEAYDDLTFESWEGGSLVGWGPPVYFIVATAPNGYRLEFIVSPCMMTPRGARHADAATVFPPPLDCLVEAQRELRAHLAGMDDLLSGGLSTDDMREALRRFEDAT